MVFPCPKLLGSPSYTLVLLSYSSLLIYFDPHIHHSCQHVRLREWKNKKKKKEELFWHRSNPSNTWQGFISCDFWCSQICQLEETLSWFETRIHMGIGFLSSMMGQTTNLVWVSEWVKPPYVHSVMRPLLELTPNQQGSHTVVISKHQGYWCPEGDLYLMKNVCETPLKSFHLIRVYEYHFVVKPIHLSNQRI